MEAAAQAKPATNAPRIGLVVDHPRRDLDGLVLAALELVDRGATAVLVPMYMSWIEAALADLDAVVLCYARRNNVEQIRFLAECGMDVFVLDTEGYLSSDRHRMLVDAIREIDAAPWLQGYLVWGKAAGEAVAAADPRLADKVVVTGCPRFDLLTPRWRDTLRFQQHDYILINPNFNGVNPILSGPETERANMLEGGWDPEYIDGFLEDMRNAFAGFLDLCHTLPKRLPHRQFIVRPHPFERHEPYAEAIAGLPNVRLNTEGPVSPVLRNARRMVHLNCNTSVEARILGLAPIQVNFLNTERLRQHLPLYAGVSVATDSLEDLCRLLDDDALLAERDRNTDLFERWLLPAFDTCDGFAARRVTEAILSRCRPKESRPKDRVLKVDGLSQKARRLLLFSFCESFGTPIIERIKYSPKKQQEKAFSPQQVQQLVNGLSDHVGRPAPPVRLRRSRWTGMPMRAIEIG